MTLYTPNRGLPYSELGDSADVPRDIRALALALDSGGGSGVALLSSVQVRDVGEQTQRRAGRVLTAADFTNMGLTAPAGLWNLGDLTDASGNGRVLSNKGGVAFTTGITGAAIEAAQFTGSTGQALYITDTGAADPFRIKTGSVGCWFRTAKRGTAQYPISKLNSTAADRTFAIWVDSTNVCNGSVTLAGAAGVFVSAVGTSDVADDRWHFGVVTHDGTRVRLYIDGVLEGSSAASGALNGSVGPLNIGAYGADASTAATSPHYGRVDESFVTADVLSPEQVLNLYCTSITHSLVDELGAAAAPTGVAGNVSRRRRGGPLAGANFPATPVRLHNFTAGALTDQGSGGVTLTSNPGTGAITSVAGADGALGGAYSFSGAHNGLSATDTGLPSGTGPPMRSYGCWFKCAAQSTGLMGWGSTNASWSQLSLNSNGTISSVSGADGMTSPGSVSDGVWHHAVVVEDNAAGDGVKRKLYLDGRCVAGSTVLTSLTLGGANRFRVGAYSDGTFPFIGQADGAFVYAGVLTAEQVHALYNVGSLALAVSPKDAGGHVEAFETTRVLAHFDGIEGTDLVNMVVTG